MNSEVIFWHQLKHQRTIINTIARSRRKWKRSMAWFPGEQERVYAGIDRIYDESREKYGMKLFKEYAFAKKLNPRIYDPEIEVREERAAEDARRAQMKLLGPQCPPIPSTEELIYKPRKRPSRR